MGRELGLRVGRVSDVLPSRTVARFGDFRKSNPRICGSVVVGFDGDRLLGWSRCVDDFCIEVWRLNFCRQGNRYGNVVDLVREVCVPMGRVQSWMPVKVGMCRFGDVLVCVIGNVDLLNEYDGILVSFVGLESDLVQHLSLRGRCDDLERWFSDKCLGVRDGEYCFVTGCSEYGIDVIRFGVCSKFGKSEHVWWESRGDFRCMLDMEKLLLDCLSNQGRLVDFKFSVLYLDECGDYAMVAVLARLCSFDVGMLFKVDCRTGSYKLVKGMRPADTCREIGKQLRRFIRALRCVGRSSNGSTWYNNGTEEPLVSLENCVYPVKIIS